MHISHKFFDQYTVERGNLIHLWELDLDILLGKGKHRKAAPASVSYAVAKVLLVGDTGVGKSGLAERLATRPWGQPACRHLAALKP